MKNIGDFSGLYWNA